MGVGGLLLSKLKKGRGSSYEIIKDIPFFVCVYNIHDGRLPPSIYFYICMLHVDIIYLACKRQKYATIHMRRSVRLSHMVCYFTSDE